MNKQELLKSRLLEVRNNDWDIPDDEDFYKLTKELMEFIGVEDPVLRDELICTILSGIIRGQLLNNDQLKEILYKLLSDDFLFHQIGKFNDGIFTRTFSMLIIAEVLTQNSKNQFINNEEFQDIVKKIIEYLKKEIDYRGYIDVKGWAHSIAHAADCLNVIVKSSQSTNENTIKIINTLKPIICNDFHVFTHNEDERITTAIISALKNDKLSIDELNEWVNSLLENKDVERSNVFVENKNRKTFLRTLYFRTKHSKIIDENLSTLENKIKSIDNYFYN